MISDAVEILRAELAQSDGGSLQPAGEEELAEARQFGFPEVLIDFYREGAPNPQDGRVELLANLVGTQRHR